MEAIAWDDNTEYFEMLALHLENYNIALETYDKPEEFIDEFTNPLKTFDFVLLDLFDTAQSEVAEEEPVGAELARQIYDRHHGKIPIYLVTNRIQAVNHQDLGLPYSILVKSKDLKPAWMAKDIVEELTKAGLFVDRKRVFLIYGHDRHTEGVSEVIEKYLEKHGLKVIKMTPGNLTTSLSEGLLRELNSCGAFIAICTPDDVHVDQKCYPRLNVFLEIGATMGLSHGIERLVILQKWGATREQKAQLPADLNGLLTIRFNEIEDIFDPLKEWLNRLRIKV